MICLTSPVMGIVMSIATLGEPLTFLFVLGTILVISSIFLVLREKKVPEGERDECIKEPINLG